MRVYRINMYDADLGALVGWAGSKREATATLSAHKRARAAAASGPEGVEPVDIPTHKNGLIAWLNANFDADNG